MPAKKLETLNETAPQRKPVRKATAAAPRKAVLKKTETVATPTPAKKSRKQRARLVRDSFTMPESDFALIATLKVRALGAKREAKKSELLRAGLHALMALDGSALVNALSRLQALPLGRPKKAN